MDNLDALCYINEQSSFPEDYCKEFGYEVHERDHGRYFLTYDAILQSFGVMNRNHRMYEAQNIMNCINTDEQIQTYLKNNNWQGEMDHPAAEKVGEELTMQRIANPNPGNTSHYIRSPRLEGNLLVAHIQTDNSTEAGRIMAIKILDGKIIPCFSARVLGALNNQAGKPVVNVKKLITFDWVMYPSHREAEAKIKQPHMESVKAIEEFTGTIIFLPELAQMAAANSKEANWLCESFGLSMNDIVGVTATGNSVVITENANTYVQPISDKIVRAKTKSVLNDLFNS